MSLKEWIVGSHKCNQHHTHRSMEEVNQCNELAKQESKNKTEYVQQPILFISGLHIFAHKYFAL